MSTRDLIADGSVVGVPCLEPFEADVGRGGSVLDAGKPFELCRLHGGQLVESRMESCHRRVVGGREAFDPARQLEVQASEAVVELLRQRPGLLLGRAEAHAKLVESVAGRRAGGLDGGEAGVEISGKLGESLRGHGVLEALPQCLGYRRIDSLAELGQTRVDSSESGAEIGDERMKLLDICRAIGVDQAKLEPLEALVDVVRAVTRCLLEGRNPVCRGEPIKPSVHRSEAMAELLELALPNVVVLLGRKSIEPAAKLSEPVEVVSQLSELCLERESRSGFCLVPFDERLLESGQRLSVVASLGKLCDAMAELVDRSFLGRTRGELGTFRWSSSTAPSRCGRSASAAIFLAQLGHVGFLARPLGEL